ncbi:MAG: hypothetical protein K2N38_12365 [Oscillospiraceae bacterium]|nr:hypothetical protein [Oscillospiraceae bacterium]
MAQKKTNIKIKHRKFNLYNKKKSKARQALTVILTIFAACALGVVGYGIGKPVLEYFQNKGQYTSDPSDSSDSGFVTDSTGSSDGSETSEPSSSSTDSSTEPSVVDEPHILDAMYFLPESAAANSTSLNSAIAAAKNAGHTVVAVTLKDQTGHFLYKTDIAGVKDTDSITGTLTAAQISDIITKAGLTPAAKISTLMDRTNPNRVDGGYELATGDGYWLDNAPTKGGKPWLSPFKTETAAFMTNITNELTAAGFEYIICADTRYPAFHTVDISTYLKNLPLSDAAKRASALWTVLDAVNSAASGKDAQMWIEISSASLLAENKSCTDAEIIADKAKTGESRIIIDYAATTTSAPPASSTTTGTSSAPSSTSSTSSTPTSSSSAPVSTPSTPTSTSSTTSSTSSAPPVQSSSTPHSSTVTPPASSSTSSSSAVTPPASSSTSSLGGFREPEISTTVTAERAAAPSGAANAYQTAKDFAAKAKAELGGAEIAVLVKGFSGSALEDVRRAFEEAGIPVYAQ